MFAWLGALVLVLVAVAAGDVDDPAAPAAIPAPVATPAPESVPVSVRFQTGHGGRPVPADFLGLSFEASALPQIAGYGSSGDFVALLRSIGVGVLRFGGVSADTRIAWRDSATPLPAWTATALEPADMRRLASLAARSGWPVLLTVGLAHYEPRSVAREVQAAKHALGPWLMGIEIGNEPDAYARHGLRALPWNPARYDGEVRRYRRAIAHLAPGIPLAAPGVSGSHSFLKWGRATARAQRPALLTGHHYPLGCHQEPAPSIPGLLSPETRRGAALSLARYMSVSRATRIPFRMDEANSVSCGGRAGISNTFAAALWATDYITQAMAAGVVGINLQGNPGNCYGYSPICATSEARLARGALTARPVWYSLLLTRSLIGSRPVQTEVSSASAPNISVRSFLAPDGSLRTVVVDDDPPGSPAAAVALRVGHSFTAATVLSLAGPSPEATAGVTLGGSAVAGDGSWHPPSHLSAIPATGGVITARIPPSSAALLTLSPAGGAKG